MIFIDAGYNGGLQDWVEGHQLREHVQQRPIHHRRQTKVGQHPGGNLQPQSGLTYFNYAPSDVNTTLDGSIYPGC